MESKQKAMMRWALAWAIELHEGAGVGMEGVADTAARIYGNMGT